MRESHFNTEIIHSLRASGAWAYKIGDAPIFEGMKTRFTPAKPCDMISCFAGRFIAIEGKQVKEYKSFGINAFQPSQIENLDSIIKVDGKSFVFLNIRIPAIKGHQSRVKRLVIFDWSDWRPLWEHGSIKKAELEALPFIEGSKGLFDLRPWLNTIREREANQ